MAIGQELRDTVPQSDRKVKKTSAEKHKTARDYRSGAA